MTNNAQLPGEVATDGKSNYTWHTEDDVRFVLDNYPNMPIDEIANRLNMTHITIVNIIKTKSI